MLLLSGDFCTPWVFSRVGFRTKRDLLCLALGVAFTAVGVLIQIGWSK